MLDTCARRGGAAVAASATPKWPRCHGRDALDMNLPARMFQRVFTCGVGVASVNMHRFAGIGRIEQGLEYGGIGHGSAGDDDVSNELIAIVHAGVQLAAEVRFTMLFGPVRADIFLRPFVEFPSQKHGVVFDGAGLVARIALYRRLHQRDINDLAAAGHVAVFLQLPLDLLEHKRASN